MSGDGGATWALIEDYWTVGTDRQFAPDGGSQWYYVVGVDAAGAQMTGRSNWVRPDDAQPALQPLHDEAGGALLDEGGQELQTN